MEHKIANKRMIVVVATAAMLLGGSAAMAQSLNLDKAVATAGKWVVRADAGDADAMWKASSPAMQKSVTQADWGKYVGNLRNAVGGQQERNWVAVSKIDNPQGLPAGEYLNVVYATRFAKAMTVETVSMAKTSSDWQPIGYVVREAKPQGAPADHAKPATAPAQPAPGK
ncbi:MAG: DUF4019 domain-containing protein [Dyella sp.]|uniref:DUF4019 domain-containing protein n=1 Tax=Dyella sp. TaxID=1869338 RepID=UPI003F8022D1